MKSDAFSAGMGRPLPWREHLVVCVLLGLACAALHHGALRVGWTFDDPAHLRMAVTHSPWQYFTQREVMLQQSYAHVSPWNVLFYEIGLPWAGLDARGHHLHLLAVLWAAAWASWALLRRGCGFAAALTGALVFLAMPATAVVGQMLMTGHYAYGLLFLVLGIHSWAAALEGAGAGRHGRASAFALLAALLYALACLCKELYAPLPAVLLFFPAARVTLRQRLLLLLPSVAVAGVYLLLRWWLFDGAGGYASLDVDERAMPPWTTVLEELRVLLMGAGALGWAASAALVLLLGLGVAGRWPRRAPAGWGAVFFWGACAVAVLLPVVPLAKSGTLSFGHHRVALAMAWALAVAAAWALHRAPRSAWLVAAALAALLVMGQWHTSQFIAQFSQPNAMQYAFQLTSVAQDRLVPREFQRISYLRDMAAVIEHWEGRPSATVVEDEDALVALGPLEGARAQAWADECRCVRTLGADYQKMVDDWLERLSRGLGEPLQVEVELHSAGLRKALRWQLSGQEDAPRAWLDAVGVGRLDLSGTQGTFAFGLDNTLPMPDPLALRLTVQTRDGALIRSPVFHLPLAGSPAQHWRSTAASPASYR